MRVGLISLSGQARDAIGNHLAEKLAFFSDRGAEVRVFLQTADRLHPALASAATVVDKAQAQGPVSEFLRTADLVIADLAQAYELLHFLPLLAGGKPRLVVEYHGVAPPGRWPGAQRMELEQGLAQRGLVWCADFALVHSAFTGAELLKATGFPQERIFQLDFPLDDRFHRGVPQWRLRAHLGLQAASILLYVGRLAPNKCVSVLVEAVACLQDLTPPAHAVIVGDATDVYAEEKRRCQELAKRLGIAGRVHFLGSLTDDQLADCYRDAEVLVMPSEHEGFCIPVLEAMASGLPVVAARATALPETLGAAGLSFAARDARELASQVQRVLTPATSVRETGRVAVVSFRFGPDIVGGAEASLRKVALALKRHGRDVEIFTTCTRAESDWTNELPAGKVHQDGHLVHRFPIDRHDRERHLESVRQITEASGRVSLEVEKAYLQNSIHSLALVEALNRRLSEFEAVVVGPYLFGLTWDIARLCPAKTLLVPCFHEEPLARLMEWPKVYSRVGGILYHSLEEQELAQTRLGVNHPGDMHMGTYLAARQPPAEGLEPRSQRVKARIPTPYLVYCGRFSRHKELPRLLDYAAQYQTDRPGRFTFVFMGRGEIGIPKKDWACDLGQVEEDVKSSVMAGAAALVQLSRQESLSLVALEAWAEGTPVLVDRRCPVLAGQVRRSEGGLAIGDYDEFTAALDDLWDNAEAWRERGRRGQAYVRQHYSSEADFAGRLSAAIEGLRVPMRERLRARGLIRAERSRREDWRDRFGQMVECVLDAAPRPYRSTIKVAPRRQQVEVKAGTRSFLVSIQISNAGTHAVCVDGPARASLFCQAGTDGEVIQTALPGLLLPGTTRSMAALVPVPAQKGEYRMRMWVDHEHESAAAPQVATFVLRVGDTGAAGCTASLLEATQAALVEAQQRRTLPDDYLDVTEGRLARWKRWIKRKLLGNFKRGYVDVLSRQQSEVNRQLLTALQHLAECCATLDHALGGMQEQLDKLERRLAAGTDDRQESKSVRAVV
jgi:glycosyltransferase involved in cell wall biosynthesis